MENNHQYCLILAGGVGSRLWPMSNEQKPKQFLDFFGMGRTLLQQTYDRYAKFIDPDHIYISTNVDYLPLVYEQLPQVDDVHILEEPLRRGTLASVAWGTVVISKADPHANVIVAPADQLIMNEDAFQQDVLHGLNFVSHTDGLAVMGVRPTRPEPGYGYIQMGEEKIEGDFTKVRSFTEKPEKQFAEMFMNDGGFLWNTGLVLFNVEVMLRTVSRLVPEYELEFPKMMAEAETADPKFLPDFFSMLPRLSIDLGVMEKMENVYVHESSFGWADLGTWGTLRAATEKTDEEENLCLSDNVIISKCHGVVVAVGDEKKVVVEGLTDYLVAEQDDLLVICPKDRGTVRRLMNETRMRLG